MSLELASSVNIKRSLDTYIKTNIYTTEGIYVDFEGVKFDQENKAEWIQPRILDSRATFLRQSSITQYGENVSFLFQTNIFVKKGGATTSDRHYAIRDTMMKYFKHNQSITIYDYAGSGVTNLGYMKVRGIQDDFSMREEQNFYQYVISWELYLTRHFTFPT